MDFITIDQVKATIDDHNIQCFEPEMCAICQRGVRYRFYRTNKLIEDSVYRQDGCDCDWLQPVLFSYAGFIQLFNTIPPTARQILWDRFVASGLGRSFTAESEATEQTEITESSGQVSETLILSADTTLDVSLGDLLSYAVLPGYGGIKVTVTRLDGTTIDATYQTPMFGTTEPITRVELGKMFPDYLPAEAAILLIPHSTQPPPEVLREKLHAIAQQQLEQRIIRLSQQPRVAD